MEKPQTRKDWQEIFQVIKTKVLQQRLLYPARLSIKMEGQIRSFPDKRRMKEYTSSKPSMQEILHGLLLKKGKKRVRGERNTGTKKNGKE